MNDHAKAFLIELAATAAEAALVAILQGVFASKVPPPQSPKVPDAGKGFDRAEYMKAWREANKAARAEYMKAWREANKDHLREYNRQYQRDRYHADPSYREALRRGWRARYRDNPAWRQSIVEKQRRYRERVKQ